MNQGGEISGTRRVVSEDRISELPEHLIMLILSLLPTNLVISTSVLSKQWRSLWTMVPCLYFETYGYEFTENVCKSILSNKAPVLKSLQLKVRDKFEDVSIGMFVGIAFTRHVREFVLDISPRYGSYGSAIKFPSSLLCLDILDTLKLKDCIFLDFPSLVSTKSLRTLHLHSVIYRNDASVRNLVSSCPNLEHLVVHRVLRSDNVVTFAIVAPSLKTLSLNSVSVIYGGGNKGYVINAPSLKLLSIESLKGYEFVRIENEFHELVEANVKKVSCIANETIMRSLKSAKRLSLDLSPLQITYPTGVSFYQLVYLEMYTHESEWWNLLTLMLDISPKLQVLKIIDNNQVLHNKYIYAEKWSQPKYVPECLLSHLETFVWMRYEWIVEAEIEVATYILRNAKQLKKATFVMRAIESKTPFRLKRRQKMLIKLNGVVKASSSCQLSFEPE